MTPQEYREKHHRCRWCKYKYLLKNSPAYSGMPKPYICLVKDKIILKDSLFFVFKSRLEGCFCKVYKPKEIDFDI